VTFRGFRLPVVAAAFIIGSLLIFGGHFFIQKYFVNEPISEYLGSYSDVKGFEIVDNSGKTQVKVVLEPVSNIAETYRDLELELQARLGPNTELVVTGSSSQRLDDLYYEFHFALYEAVQKGNFSEMHLEAERLFAGTEGATYRLFVDEERIYLQLSQEPSYLYKIVSREEAKPGEVQ